MKCDIEIQEQMTVTVKGTDIQVDIKAITEYPAIRTYLLEYGIKQSIADSASGIKATDTAGIKKECGKRIAKFLAGKVPSGGGNPGWSAGMDAADRELWTAAWSVVRASFKKSGLKLDWPEFFKGFIASKDKDAYTSKTIGLKLAVRDKGKDAKNVDAAKHIVKLKKIAADRVKREAIEEL